MSIVSYVLLVRSKTNPVSESLSRLPENIVYAVVGELGACELLSASLPLILSHARIWILGTPCCSFGDFFAACYSCSAHTGQLFRLPQHSG
jgi:hypothetical protein